MSEYEYTHTETHMTARQEQASATRARLLSSARKLFAEQGYDGTQVRAINRSIGMADGLMYHYFPGGKKEILRVLVRESLREMGATLQARVKELDTCPIPEVMEQMYVSADAIVDGHLDILKIIFKEREMHEEFARGKVVQSLQMRKRWFPAYLQSRAAAGEIREIDYESAAEMMSAVIVNHFLIKLSGIGISPLSDSEHRKRLIAYQVGLWAK